MDVIVAAGLLFTLILFIGSMSFAYSSPEMKYQRIYYAGKDMLNVINKMKLRYAETNITQKLLDDKIIEPNDVDKTVLDIIGSLWVSKNVTKQMYAKNLTEDIFDRTLNPKLGYELLLNDNTIYRKNDTYVDFISRLSTIQSGYEIGKPVSGYLARAWATKIKKNTTDVFPFHIEGAGNEGGKFEVWKRFELNATTIINGTFYISVHYGRSADEFENLVLNGNNIKTNINWIHEEEDTTGTGAFGVVDIKDELINGVNEVYLRFKNSVYNAHIHPGMRMEITYETEEIREATKTRKERIYFDHVETGEVGARGSGAWAMMSYYIPKNVTLKSVKMHFRGEEVENTSLDDVRVYFNESLYDLQDPLANGTVELNYDFTNMTTEGSNMVLIQLNYRVFEFFGIPFDDFFGDDDTIIYSDPFNDPNGSSYVEVEYDLPEGKIYYGYIDVGISELFGGVRDNPKTYTANFENKILENSFLRVAQLFSQVITVDVWPESEPAQTIFVAPVPRMIPAGIYIDPYYFDITKNNSVRVSDSCMSCDILPESALQYYLWIPNSVSYGDVFENVTAAVDDAHRRLNETLGKYAIATSIKTETSSISGVPTLWGPAKFEIRVWI